jgi:serine/threonine-protein kinase ATR
LYDACKKSEAMLFCTVHALLSSLRDFLTDSMFRKGYVLLSILCAGLLEHPAELSEKSIRLNLCSSILNLVAICKKHHSMRQIISLHLAPAIEASLVDDVACANLGQNFQVCPSCDPPNAVLIDTK